MPPLDAVLLLVVALVLALGLGLVRFYRRRTVEAGPTLPAATVPAVARGAASPSSVAGQRICTAFHAWLAENHDGPAVWASFDQLVREALTAHLRATRVRCFHVRPGADVLQTVHSVGKAPAPPGPSAREGLLGYVATTGTEYAAGDAAHGPLLDQLAAQVEDGWQWVWPVRESGRAGATIGVIAVGQLRELGILTPQLRQAVGPLLSLCWQHVASLECLRTVKRTDQASGVLTRNDFFTLAQRALAGSYAANEPVVVAVLVLEGLRRLDDAHCWRERDTLIERVGELVAGRTRSDDVVGRFADDRFVILLRRLDSGLGRLIAEKMLAAANECIAGLDALGGRVQLRMGLAGSGLAHPPLQSLMQIAFDAVNRARRDNVALATDLKAAEGQRPATPEGPAT